MDEQIDYAARAQELAQAEKDALDLRLKELADRIAALEALAGLGA